MTVKDLQIGSPVYRVKLDSIDVARIRLIEQKPNGIRAFELAIPWRPRFCENEDATEMKEMNSPEIVWYVNIEDAQLDQLVRRSEYVESLKRTMESAQNAFAEAIQKYVFSGPSTPKEM